MKGSQFHLVVQEVYALKRPYVAVIGTVEGGSISVDDRVQLCGSEGKKPKARVEKIEVLPQLEITTAEPGRTVRLLLCGIKAEQISKGDILEPPQKGSLKSSKTVEVFLVILGGLVVGNLLYAGICLLFGYRDENQEFLRKTVSHAVVYLVLFSGILACDGLSKRFWRRKNQQDDWDTEFRVLKCIPQAYALVILAVLLTLGMGVLFSQATAEEVQTLWENGGLTYPILFVFGYDIIAILVFLYYNRRKVFYSRYQFRLVSFWRHYDTPWTRVRAITLVQKKKKSRLVLTAAERTIVLRSEVLEDGWGDFVDFTRRMARKYHISFEERQEKTR